MGFFQDMETETIRRLDEMGTNLDIYRNGPLIGEPDKSEED